MALTKLEETIVIKTEGVKEATAGLNKMDDALDNVAASAGDASGGVDKFGKSAKGVTKLSAELEQAIVEGAAAMKRMDERADKAARSTAKMGDSSKQAENKLQKLGNKVLTVSTATLALDAAFRAAAAGARILSEPIEIAAGFERQFALMSTLSKDVTPTLKKDLENLASELPFTLSEVGAAAEKAISNNIKPSEVVEFIRASSDAAVGSGNELLDTVKILSAGVNAFGKQGETAASVADKFQATIKLGSSNGRELASVFGDITAAAPLGVSLADYSGALAFMTQRGVEASVATTQLDGVIRAIGQDTGASKEAFKALGIETGTLALQQRGLGDILREVQDATGGATEEIAKLSNDSRAKKGFMALFSDMELVQEKIEGIRDSSGASRAAAEIVGDTTFGAWKKFDSALESVQKKLGESLLPVVTEMLEDLTKYLNDNADSISGKFKDALETLISFGQFVVNNGRTIKNVIAGIFIARTVTNFTNAMSSAFTEFSKMASGGIGKGIAAGLRSPAGIGLIIGAVTSIAMMIGDVISAETEQALKEKEEEMRRAREAAEAQRETDAKQAGFKGGTSERESTIEEIRAGEAFLRSTSNIYGEEELAEVSADNIIAKAELMAMEPEEAKKIVEANKEFFQKQAEILIDAASSASAIKGIVEKVKEKQFDQTEFKIPGRSSDLEWTFAQHLRSAVGEDDEDEKIAYLQELFSFDPKRDRDAVLAMLPSYMDIDDITRSNWDTNTAYDEQKALEAKTKAIESLNAHFSVLQEIDQGIADELAATEAKGREAEERKRRIEEEKKKKEEERRAAKEAKAAEARKRAARSRYRARKRAADSAEKRWADMAIDMELSQIEDEQEREIQTERERQRRQIRDAPDLADTSKLIEVHKAKIDAINEKYEKRRQDQQTKADEAELKLGESKQEAITNLAIRRAELSGDTIKAEMLRLEDAHSRELLELEAHGLRTQEMEQALADERVKIKKQMVANMAAQEHQIAANTAQSVESILGSVQSVAEAAGASSEVTGAIEAAMILSRSVWHGFEGASQLAMAASAMAGAGPLLPSNPAKAAAHKMAAVAHFAQAAAGGVAAGQALMNASGGSVSAGGGGLSAPGSSLPNASTGPVRADLADRSERPAVSFGDIVLADMPALLSRDGQRAMGQAIAGEVARELGRRSNIRGSARIPERAMRR